MRISMENVSIISDKNLCVAFVLDIILAVSSNLFKIFNNYFRTNF